MEGFFEREDVIRQLREARQQEQPAVPHDVRELLGALDRGWTGAWTGTHGSSLMSSFAAPSTSGISAWGQAFDRELSFRQQDQIGRTGIEHHQGLHLSHGVPYESGQRQQPSLLAMAEQVYGQSRNSGTLSSGIPAHQTSTFAPSHRLPETFRRDYGADGRRSTPSYQHQPAGHTHSSDLTGGDNMSANLFAFLKRCSEKDLCLRDTSSTCPKDSYLDAAESRLSSIGSCAGYSDGNCDSISSISTVLHGTTASLTSSSCGTLTGSMAKGDAEAFAVGGKRKRSDVDGKKAVISGGVKRDEEIKMSFKKVKSFEDEEDLSVGPGHCTMNSRVVPVKEEATVELLNLLLKPRTKI